MEDSALARLLMAVGIKVGGGMTAAVGALVGASTPSPLIRAITFSMVFSITNMIPFFMEAFVGEDVVAVKETPGAGEGSPMMSVCSPV